MQTTAIMVVSVLLLSGGTAAIVLGMEGSTIGGPEPGDGVTYRVAIEGAEIGNLTILRAPDAQRPGPDGVLRAGSLYQAEWQLHGIRLASEELHVAQDGIWRRATNAFGFNILAPTTVAPGLGLVDVEHVRFSGPSPLCGFILGPAFTPSPVTELPGCASGFDAIHDGVWRLAGDDLLIHVDGGDAWPERVLRTTGVAIEYRRAVVGQGSAGPSEGMGAIRAPAPAPVMETGPDDAGMPGWAVAEAFALARDDVYYRELHDYLAEHPQAVMAAAAFSYRTEQDWQGDDELETWHWVFSDGLSRFAMLAARGESAGGGPMGPLLSVVRGGEYTFEALDAPSDVFPAPTERPQAMPRYQDVVTAWHDATGEGRPADTYGFTTACGPKCGEARVWVGNKQEADLGFGGFGSWGLDLEAAADTFTVDQDGMLVGLDRHGSFFEGAWLGWPDDGFFGVAFARLSIVPVSGAAAILVGLVAAASLLWKSAPIAGLFSRVHGEQALASPERRRIYELIQARPGIHHKQIVRATGRGNGSVEHHLRTLLRTGHLTERRTRGFVCYYVKGSMDRRVMDALPVLKSPLARRILEAIQATPGISGAGLAAATGGDGSTVSYHLGRMETVGLIERRRVGRAVQAFPAPVAGDVLRAAA